MTTQGFVHIEEQEHPFRIHIKVTGVSFGSFHDSPNSTYAIAMFDDEKKELSNFYTFEFSKRFTISVKFKIKTFDIESKFITFYVYKMKFITKELLGKLSFPISAFPVNKVCHEKLAFQLEKFKKSPISIIFDIHVDSKHKRPYKAPKGESPYEQFDSGLYQQEHIEREPTNTSILTTSILKD